MASQKTNAAVAQFRKVALMEIDTQLQEFKLTSMALALDLEEMADYVELTEQIHTAIDEAWTTALDLGWKLSTARQEIRRRANAAGLDHTKVTPNVPGV